MTRVDGQQTSSDVDNCCFVNRQCSNDHEWVEGYWAHQRNECPVGTAPTGSTPVTTSTDASDVNNCCFTGWLCHTQQDWEKGFHAYQENRCLHRGLAIEGPESFVAQLHIALDLIQERSSHWYGFIISGLTKILYDPSAPRSAVNSRSGIWHVPPSRVETWRDMVSIVGSLAHEACHVHRHRAGQVSGGLVGERDCLEKQIAAARAVYPSGREGYIDWATNLLANIDNPEFQWWH